MLVLDFIPSKVLYKVQDAHSQGVSSKYGIACQYIPYGVDSQFFGRNSVYSSEVASRLHVGTLRDMYRTVGVSALGYLM